MFGLLIVDDLDGLAEVKLFYDATPAPPPSTSSSISSIATDHSSAGSSVDSPEEPAVTLISSAVLVRDYGLFVWGSSLDETCQK